MSNKRKFLEGELKYSEGKTSVKDILTTVSSELVKSNWVDYTKQGVDYPWTFDRNREIQLDDTFKKEHVKLFKIIGMTEISPSGIPFGEMKVMRDVSSNSEKVVILRLNGKDYSIPLELNDTREQVATKIANFVKLIEGFEDTIVELDGVTVKVAGSFAVYELSTNYDIDKFTNNEVVSFSKIKKSFKTGKIEVVGDCQIDGNLTITINDGLLDTNTITVFITRGTNKNDIATLIKNEILLITPYNETYVVDNIVYVEGGQDVVSISLNTDSDKTTNIKTTVRPTENVGDLEVFSTSIKNGDIRITIKSVGAPTPQNITVAVSKGDTNKQIAEKIRFRLAQYGYIANQTENILNILNIAELSSDMTMEDSPIAVTTSEVSLGRGMGIVEFITDAEVNQQIKITINGIEYSVPILGGITKNQVAEEVKEYFLNHESDEFERTFVEGSIVTIRGKIDITSISTNTDIEDNKPYIFSKVIVADKYKGEITIIQPMTTNDNLIVTLNGANIIIPLLSTDNEASVATKIKDQILLESGNFLDTRISSDNDRVVIIEGIKSVESLSVSGIEIPSENYDVVESTVIGKGDITSGTNIGDNVLIKTIYTGEVFQKLCFSKETMTDGTVKNIAKLKSRPQGDISLYHDTIINVTKEVATNSGDGLVYKLGKTPISKSKAVGKEVTVYKDNVEVDKSKYVVDYYNGLIIFKEKNLIGNVISVSYGFSTGILGDEIPSESYRIINDEIIDVTDLGTLADVDVVVMAFYYWDIVFPATIQQVDSSVERILLKTKIDSTQARNKTFKKDYYVEMKHIKAEKENFLTGLEIRFGTMLDSTKTTLDANNCSEWARVAWYDKKGLRASGDTLLLEDWLPITYHMNFTQEYVNIILHGSPVVDTTSRDNYLISPIMIGALENYVEVMNEDIQYNFGMTVGSDNFYSSTTMPKKWGDKTGTGITDFVMERTGDGVPYQAHGTSFHTSPEFMDKLVLGASEYTDSQHFSKIVITHEVQRERGMIQSVLIGDRSAIFHLDELITNKEEFNKQGIMLSKEGNKFNPCGNANISQEKKWVMININSPYWIANNSPNTFYGIALRKS